MNKRGGTPNPIKENSGNPKAHANQTATISPKNLTLQMNEPKHRSVSLNRTNKNTLFFLPQNKKNSNPKKPNQTTQKLFPSPPLTHPTNYHPYMTPSHPPLLHITRKSIPLIRPIQTSHHTKSTIRKHSTQDNNSQQPHHTHQKKARRKRSNRQWRHTDTTGYPSHEHLTYPLP